MKHQEPRKQVQTVVQRVAQSGIILKKGGEVPELGQVNRMPRTLSQDVRDPGARPMDAAAERQERLRRGIVVGWSVSLGVVAVAALVVAFAVWVRPILNRAKDTTERQRLATDARVRKVSRFASPTEDEAVMAVRRALDSATVEDVARTMRLGRHRPEDVLKSMAELKRNDGRILEEIWLGSVDKNGLSLEGVELSYDEFDPAVNRLALLTPDNKGVWKMDYEAFARVVEPSWPEILDRKDGEGIVRVWVVRERYYNGPFMNDKEWVAYTMASQDMDEVLVGYCRRWSAQHRALELMWEDVEGSTVRATLEIERVEGAERRQFQINRVLAEDWVMGDRPFDELLGGGLR